ncbi:MAG: hypothetical protein J7L37_02720 [Thermococcus sp.]|nr:hypothetical protein [Thermococcus sp.]
MTTLEDVRSLTERGYYEEALEKIPELEDPLDQLEALRETVQHIVEHRGPVEWIPDIVEDMQYITKKLKEAENKALGYGMIGSALAVAGYTSEAAEFFERAIKETRKIKNDIERGEVLANIAYELAVAGYPEEALEIFDSAFDTIIYAGVNYNLKVDAILHLGELMEKTGDILPAQTAMKFYRMAFDIFDKLQANQKAAIADKKFRLSQTVYDVGLPSIRKALLEGRPHYALALMEKMYEGTPRLIGTLEIALWMKMVNDLEYIDVVERAFQKCKDLRLTEANTQKIAKLLTDLGELKKAMEFSERIGDPEKRSEVIKAIALELAKMKKLDEAIEIAHLIPIPRIRDQTLEDIITLEEKAGD